MKKTLLKFFAIFSAITTFVVQPVFAEPVTLLVSFSYGPYKPMFDDLKHSFEVANPGIKINYLTPIMDTHEDHLQQVFRARLTDNVPDVSFQGNHLVSFLVQRDFPVPLDPFIDKDSEWKGLGVASGALSVARRNGKTYGIGFQTSAPAILYNGALVRRAGGDPANLPKTWPDVLALSKKIQALGGGAMGGFFDYDASGNFTFQALLQGQGGSMMSPDEKALAFNSPQGILSLDVLRQFATDAGMQDMTRNQAYQAFGAGTIGVFPTASSNIGQFEQLAGGRFDVLVGPWPVKDGSGSLPAGGRTVMMFTHDASKQQAAWKFIKFVEGPTGQTSMAKFTGSLPNNDIAVADPKYLADFYKEHPNQLVLVKQLKSMGNFYSFPGEHTAEIVTAITNHLQGVVSLKDTPETAMAGMVRDVQALLPN